MSNIPLSINKEDTALKSRTETEYPSMYRVIMLNDDYTPMDFVVKIINLVFEHSIEKSRKIMLDVHKSGVGECGIYTFEIAETKIAIVTELARKESYPLQCEMEKV